MFFPEDSQVRNLVFLILLSQYRMDGHVFRYSQANSIGIRACTLHALRNLFQHYTRVSSFWRCWRREEMFKVLNTQELKILQKAEQLARVACKNWVAVGTLVARRPQHRSVRAGLPHTATLNSDVRSGF